MPFRNYVEETAKHMDALMPGDRFSEMLSYWIWIETVDELGVVALETHAGPDSKWERKTWPTADAFRKKYTYGSMPGYWVYWIDNKPMA